MKRKFIKKSIIYTLISSMLLGSTTPALAGKDSIGSVTETQESNKNENLNTTVYAEVGSFFKVTIPKHIVLDGTEKKGEYLVTAVGDIAGYETLYIKPDDSFVLKSANLNDVTATINQNKTSWKFDEMLEGSNILGNGLIDAADISAGSWNGNFNFNINLDGSTTSIKVEAKDEDGNNLNASAYNISGSKKDALLNGLVEAGMINSANEVDALIEVESDEFEGLAETTFDVSSIAKEGDKVVILHFNETKQEWEYIGTETVDSNGLIKGNFTSYSPVAFVKVNEDGSFNQHEHIYGEPTIKEPTCTINGTKTFTCYCGNSYTENIEKLIHIDSNNDTWCDNCNQAMPGLYDANGVMLCTWEESGIDVETNYTSSTYKTNPTSPCYVLTNIYPTTTKIILPEEIKTIGEYSFYYCTNLINITIPNSVTNIKQYAFFQCNNLINITIPNSVTRIGQNAFSYCSSLTSITIPNSVTSIGYCAFACCTGLTSITIPNTVTSIDTSPLSGCHNLKSIIVSPGNPRYDSRDNCNAIIDTRTNKLISGCQNTIIPNGVTSIGMQAFWGCKTLTNIKLPNSITEIGDHAFAYCSDLVSIEIPNSITDIKEYAFIGCNSISNFNIPNNLTNINKGLFHGCSSLTNISIPNSVTNIGKNAFSGCKTLTSITIPDSVTSIGDSAFSGCSGLTSITIPNSVTSIGNSVFYGCIGLTSITIPDSVTSIGDSAFSNCEKLISIKLSNNLTNIADGMFSCCYKLKNIEIPNNVVSIGVSAFSNCTVLTSITIPDSVTNISYYAFNKCSNLKNVTFADTTTWYIGNSEGETTTKITVADTSINATNLKSTYLDKYWTKK